ncbi:MAG: hypothetical protein QM478_00325 [Flavobacteriaceae bacterium]
MNLEDDKLIENFLRENLSKDEKVDFLNRVETDLNFKEQFIFEKQLFKTLDNVNWSFGNHSIEEVNGYKELFNSKEAKDSKKNFQKINQNYQRLLNKRQLLKWLMSSAATLVLIFMTYSIFFKRTSNQDLYAKYLDKTELPSLVVRGGSSNSNLVLGQQYFESEEYKKTLETLNKKQYNNDASVYLYIGISQMELNQYKEAEDTFNRLINSDFIDASKGGWYKALLYIKMNKIGMATEQLKNIIKTASFNSSKAEKLLNEIE